MVVEGLVRQSTLEGTLLGDVAEATHDPSRRRPTDTPSPTHDAMANVSIRRDTARERRQRRRHLGLDHAIARRASVRELHETPGGSTGEQEERPERADECDGGKGRPTIPRTGHRRE